MLHCDFLLNKLPNRPHVTDIYDVACEWLNQIIFLHATRIDALKHAQYFIDHQFFLYISPQIPKLFEMLIKTCIKQRHIFQA